MGIELRKLFLPLFLFAIAADKNSQASVWQINLTIKSIFEKFDSKKNNLSQFKQFCTPKAKAPIYFQNYVIIHKVPPRARKWENAKNKNANSCKSNFLSYYWRRATTREGGRKEGKLLCQYYYLQNTLHFGEKKKKKKKKREAMNFSSASHILCFVMQYFLCKFYWIM